MSDDPRQNLPPQVADALAKGNLIAAIKYLREQKPNLGLAEAKALIEAIQRQQGGNVKMNVNAAVKTAAGSAPTRPHSTPHSPPHAAMTPSMDPRVSPGEMPRTSGNAGFAMLVVAIAVVIAAAMYFGS
ncbi:MAG TPA: hypothetical protein VLH12_03450 [Usitatibacter sp.]|nr:hypothetical protein [Usitatibacter sp.]